jgi:hypothetical protein
MVQPLNGFARAQIAVLSDPGWAPSFAGVGRAGVQTGAMLAPIDQRATPDRPFAGTRSESGGGR